MASIALDQLTKHYAERRIALDRFCLEIHDGELLVLLGPSGSGKTTALRLIAGLEPPTSGSIRIAGRDVTHVPARERNVAMVFQHAVLYAHWNVRRNLEFGLRMRKLPRQQIEQRVGRIAELLEIDDFLARRPYELSGGQRQRVALGRALVHQADCYLLDEPLTHLDADARRALRDRIRDLHAELQATIIYVTHDQSEAMTLGQRIAVLDKGVLQQCAEPLKVYQRPANRTVAASIGAAPMNFFAARIDPSGALSMADGELQLPLSQDTARLIKGQPGDVFVGLRPEAIRLGGNTTEQTRTTISARIVAIYQLGDHLELRLAAAPLVLADGQSEILASVPLDSLGSTPRDSRAVGETVQLVVQPRDLHLFDASGRNLLLDKTS